MRKNFLSFLTAIFAIALVLSALTNAEASRQRMAGLGMDGADSYWMIQKDTATITTVNPAALIEFPSLIALNYGTTRGGTFANPDPNATPQNSNGNVFLKFTEDFSVAYAGDNAAPFNLYAAYKMGDTIIGLQAIYTSYSDGGATKDYQDFGGKIGIRQKLGSDDVDITVKYIFADGTATGDKKFQDISSAGLGYDKYNGIGLAEALVRYNMAFSEIQKLHILAKFTYTDLSSSDKVSGDKNDKVQKDLLIGISDEMKLSASALAYVGLYGKYTSQSSVSTVGGVKGTGTGFAKEVVAMHAGVEGQLVEVLKGRIGFKRNIYNYATVTGDPIAYHNVANGTASTENPTNAVFSGLTFAFGQFRLDFDLNMAMVKNGPYFITGNGTVWSADVNIAYLFDAPVLSK